MLFTAALLIITAVSAKTHSVSFLNVFFKRFTLLLLYHFHIKRKQIRLTQNFTNYPRLLDIT
uniref:Uncharacterized protein n=1 Tax=Myoviridae sp. ctLx49 TaxID=2825086 RepID=A0A8S5UV41_9CAUD|nr:MAG TPA: hypothetical protein [Myoviridae sp. ctLx49]